MDGNGGCCIARWNDGGHVAGGGGYDDMRKMDMIMLKFRPIAPKPVSQNGSVSATSDGSAGSPPEGRHAKAALKGRRKTCTAKKANNNTKKRKSNYLHNETTGVIVEQEGQGEVTLLPLFPEAPDLSPTKHHQPNNLPFWLNFNNNNNNNHDNYNNNNYYYYDNYGNCNEIRYGFEENYGKCQGQGQGW